ncbi:hypothetical protein V6Z11_A11G153500 [Gossypium hirsutum]
MTLPKKDPNYLSQISQPINLPPLMEANAVKRKNNYNTEPKPQNTQKSKRRKKPTNKPKAFKPFKAKNGDNPMTRKRKSHPLQEDKQQKKTRHCFYHLFGT